MEWEATGASHRMRGHVTDRPHLRVTTEEHMEGVNVAVGGLAAVGPLGLARRGPHRLVAEPGVTTGDPAFDRAVCVTGPPALALARLDAETRRRVLDTFPAGGTLEQGTLRAFFAGDTLGRRELFGTLVELACRLDHPCDTQAALAASAAGDPLPGVRRVSLGLLASEFPGATSTRQTLLAARNDSSKPVALAAAVALGAEGQDTLRRLARDPHDDETAAAAIAALGPSLPGAELLQIFGSARGRPHTTLACIAAVAAQPESSLVAHAESLLIDALQGPDERVPEAAARVLAQVGTSAAVLPLREAARGGAGALPGLARAAADAIQARLRGAAPGQVSLAPGAAGEVSLTGDASGRVSVAKKD